MLVGVDRYVYIAFPLWSVLVADVNTALDSDFVSASLILFKCTAVLH